MKLKTDFAVIGSGAGGATIAMELAKKGRKVLILDKGSFAKESEIGTLRSAVLTFYDRCALRASKEGIIIYRALMAGGTTFVSCGNGLPVLVDELEHCGIDLKEEFEETERELSIARLPDDFIGPGSRLIMNAANRLGFDMGPMPKFINTDKCILCGKCVLGCKTGAKWSALDYIKVARKHGAKFVKNIDVKSIVTHNGKAVGVVGKSPKGTVRVFANKIIVAAGGIGTPAILKRSGIENAGNKLFADLFNVTYGIFKGEKINQWKEVSMSVLSAKFLKDRGFIISPFIDVPLILRWITSKKRQLQGFRYKKLLGIMVKIKDDSKVMVTEKGNFEKAPTINDNKRLNEGANIAEQILRETGIKSEDIFHTKPRAAHPGGSAAIGEVVDADLETKIKNLYVCDASVLPLSPGAPPIVTIVALAKRLAKRILAS
ncbi:MAG: GMC family oxidoreductase N-terminal domain-containing protein [Candidatus Omnitrophota bacterium]